MAGALFFALGVGLGLLIIGFWSASVMIAERPLPSASQITGVMVGAISLVLTICAALYLASECRW